MAPYMFSIVFVQFLDEDYSQSLAKHCRECSQENMNKYSIRELKESAST